MESIIRLLAFIQLSFLHENVCSLCFFNFELNELGVLNVVLERGFKISIINDCVHVEYLEVFELKKLFNVFL